MIDWEAVSARYHHRQDFIKKLLAVALDTHGATGQALGEAIEQDDYQRVAFLAHGIKGAAGALHAASLSDLAQQAEHAARQRSDDAMVLAVALLDQVEPFLECLRNSPMQGQQNKI